MLRHLLSALSLLKCHSPLPAPLFSLHTVRAFERIFSCIEFHIFLFHFLIALKALSDQAIDYRLEVEKSYTATNIGTQLGISPQKVGSIANKHNLKTNEYGYFALDKSPYSNKQVESFRYFEKGRKKIEEIVQGKLVN